MKYKIIDNFLNLKNFDNIVETFFPKNIENLKSCDKFTWFFQKGIVKDPKLGHVNYEKDNWIYTHELYSSDNGLKYSKHYSIIKPIIERLNVKKLFDIRANLLVPTKDHIHHEFHVDRNIEHNVALFYVTHCNGFTILRDTDKIECVKNRMLIFDGSIEHCSVTSTDYPRCVININYVSNT